MTGDKAAQRTERTRSTAGSPTASATFGAAENQVKRTVEVRPRIDYGQFWVHERELGPLGSSPQGAYRALFWHEPNGIILLSAGDSFHPFVQLELIEHKSQITHGWETTEEMEFFWPKGKIGITSPLGGLGESFDIPPGNYRTIVHCSGRALASKYTTIFDPEYAPDADPPNYGMIAESWLIQFLPVGL